MTNVQQIGRLAMREEGTYWVAYYAEQGTMRGAIKLGMVAMAFVRRDQNRKKAFMDFMQDAVADIIQEQTGERPVWPDGPRPAPEHERLDNA